MDLKEYYGSNGNYLTEHQEYFSKQQLQADISFLVDVLELSKKDKILDLACGHGRHTIELAKRGFDVDGLDFSNTLLQLARKEAEQEKLAINFYEQDIHKIDLETKYEKMFLFFSEFGLFDANKVLCGIVKVLKKDGLFLLDCDNVFRLIQYLLKHPDSPYKFDFVKMELKEKDKFGQGVKYYIISELEQLFNNHGLKIRSIYGNYLKDDLDIYSKRIILVGQKQ